MSIVEKFRKSQAEKKLLEDRETAGTLFQIKEYDGEIWITFDGNLICPCSMLNAEPVEAVLKMRELYIKRSEV